ncbi:hypothetical protein [Tsukamurella pseudospumae]|uniref:Uncharacterized protein n=1 Tax=Tsukamurella pseudospumae TaxID=239498 RepID=A0A138A7K7_9ACTN|nr:hypothetical protein [Tsukamurella pseudospumae]KXP06442.1 hypothetical protein AXK60_10140 [Tsukamurella pseudospumae]
MNWTAVLLIPVLLLAALYLGVRWFVNGMFDVGPPHTISEQEARQELEDRSIHIPSSFRLDSMTIYPVFAGRSSYRGTFSAPADRFDDYRQIVAKAPGMIDPSPVGCTPSEATPCPSNLIVLSYPPGGTGMDTTTLRISRTRDSATIAVDAQGH